jgi:glucosamine 6-phosphate synthetase-like amidotransferase/phosphosugar isomerase protein
MCGIVGYFGGAGNNLTRVLTAMSAIIYRAPDSTGVATFGDDVETIRSRKSLGAVDQLIGELIRDPIYPNTAQELMGLWTGTDGATPGQAQRRLLELEGLSCDNLDTLQAGSQTYPSFDELVDLTAAKQLSAGFPGRPSSLLPLRVSSKSELKDLVHHLVSTHDLSFTAVQVLLRNSLHQSLLKHNETPGSGMDPTELLNVLDQVYEGIFLQESAPRPSRLDYGSIQGSPEAEKQLWRYLSDTSIQVPTDYDRDGVRCLFRLLDAALLCRLPLQSDLADRLGESLRTDWPEFQNFSHLGWRLFYQAEKGANLFGRAAAVGLAWLQRQEPLGQSPTVVPGQTDAISLRYLSTPILSQGRWALQSPVTVQNSHPFFDAPKHRGIVLNGHFNAEVEADLHDFLEDVAGFSFRSENSSEYFALLWGYFFEWLSSEKSRYENIRTQIEAGLEGYSIGSQSIDYQIYQRIKDKSPSALDEMAFLEAVRRVTGRGGQVAVAGLSLHSPQRLYVASHNRPVFVVGRLDNDDFMVVSDINAALGLFPQEMLREKTLKLRRVHARRTKALAKLHSAGSSHEAILDCRKKYQKEEDKILEALRVKVFVLEGEDKFVRIHTQLTNGTVHRTANISDFEGNPLPEVESFSAVLNPLLVRTDLHGSFFQTHLHEIPGRLEDILRFYLSGDEDIPEFNLQTSVLRRRFGQDLGGIRRIVLAGMGSAYNMGAAAVPQIQELLPGMDILLLRPVEVEDVSRVLIPEKDLVLLLSWSGTTADMVEFAKDLEAHHLVMIAVTEKRFADIGLIAQKSGGVINILSGEEVTVSGIKSTTCMLFCLGLFFVWMADRMGRKGEALAFLDKLKEVPTAISEVFESQPIRTFSSSIASQAADSYAVVLIDALHSAGIGREAALKMEEASWTATGKSVDYRDASLRPLHKNMNEVLVLVNATLGQRLPEAVGLMKQLFLRNVPYAAVTYTDGSQTEIEDYSQGRCVYLPKLDGGLQPFVDLAFYYHLAFHFGLAHGRRPEDFPRNRAKSVTSGRTPEKKHSPAAELFQLEQREAAAILREPKAKAIQSSWKEMSKGEEHTYYSAMHKLAQSLQETDPLKRLLRSSSRGVNALGAHLFGPGREDLEIILVPLDLKAETAARNLSAHWGRYLGRNIRVAAPETAPTDTLGEHLFFLLGTRRPSDTLIQSFLTRPPKRWLWCGPNLPKDLADAARKAQGYFVLKLGFQQAESDLMYAVLGLLLLRAWKKREPEKAASLERHFRRGTHVIERILNHVALKEHAWQSMHDNRRYRTAHIVGPYGGTGPGWVGRFDQLGGITTQWHLLGESVHGPVVTVDPRVDTKYVEVVPRSQMVSNHGESRVSDWERLYLKGRKTDHFLLDPSLDGLQDPYRPFFANSRWYLPILRDDYDAVLDNLIIIDATVERHFDQIMDELGSYGCRYARMILVAQESSLSLPERRAIYQYPISHLLLLPSETEAVNGSPISGLLLPFAMNPLGMALAKASAETRQKRFAKP